MSPGMSPGMPPGISPGIHGMVMVVNLLDICEYHSLNVNLDFPSTAILFNQLQVTVSVLRSISDGVANLPCADQLQELVHAFLKFTCIGGIEWVK